MEKAGTSYLDYSGDEATPQVVQDMLRIWKGAHFLFFNHANEQGLIAQGGQEYIIDKSNDELLIGRIVYTLACSWGLDGGWQAHRKGAKAVHCYAAVVGFMTSALPEFQESFNHGFKLLHEQIRLGLDPNFEEILAFEKEKMTELSDKLMKQGNFMAASWMNRNRDSLKWYNGNDEPPESKCFWRRLAVKLFGPKRGWSLLKRK